MAAGIIIRNGNGIVQIDDSYSNLELTSVANVLCQTVIYGNHYYTDYVVNGGQYPMVAITATSPCFWYPIAIGSGTMTIRIICKARITVRVFIFSEPLSDPSGIGIRIRNKVTGKTAYNSLRKSMRVLDMVNGYVVNGDPVINGISRVYPNKTVAVAQGIFAYKSVFIKMNPTNPNDIMHFVDLSSVYFQTTGNGSAVSIKDDVTWSDIISQAGAASRSGFQRVYNLLVIDVTGY